MVKEIKQAIANLVKQILAAKEHNPSIDTTELENEIDRLVYQYYDLNSEDIAIVEAATQ